MTQLEHYKKTKEQYQDALLLFRCGDFYETYCDDAAECADILGITLVFRNGHNIVGFPFHSLDTYLPKLVRAGKKVAICDPADEEPISKAEKVTLANDGYYISDLEYYGVGLRVSLTKDKNKADGDLKVTYSVDNDMLTIFRDGTPIYIASNFVLRFK